MSKDKKQVSEEELPVIALDYKRRPAKEQGFQTKGWKFYISIKELLPDWWEEFNGRVSRKSNHPVHPKYKSVRHFAKHKIKNTEQRQWFIWMTGPKKVWEQESLNQKRYTVPWLGDWYKRRLNGRWQPENKEYFKSLNLALRSNLDKNQAIRATAPFLVKQMMRWIKWGEKIDEAFDGELFVNDDPGSTRSKTRFDLYKKMHDQIESRIIGITHEWMRIHGVNPNDPHEMWDMGTIASAIGQSSAAAALTGYAAGNQLTMDQNNGNSVMQLNGQGIVISPDALLLAQHLTKHSNTFRKPLPVTIDAEPEMIPEVKKNGHAKTQ